MMFHRGCRHFHDARHLQPAQLACQPNACFGLVYLSAQPVRRLAGHHLILLGLNRPLCFQAQCQLLPWRQRFAPRPVAK